MNRRNLSAILRCIVATAFLVLYVMAYIAFEKTVVEWWKLVVVGVCAIAVTGMTKMKRWRWLTGTDDRTLNGLFHVYAVGAMALGAFSSVTTGYLSAMVTLPMTDRRAIWKRLSWKRRKSLNATRHSAWDVTAIGKRA